MNPYPETLGGEPSIAHEDTSGLVETAGEVYVQAIPVPAVETGGWKATMMKEVGRSAEEASCGKGERGGPIDQGQANGEPTCSIETNYNIIITSRRSADDEASKEGTGEAGNDGPPTPDDLPPVWPPTSDGPPTNDPDGNSRRPPESPDGDTRPPPPQSGEASDDGPPTDDPIRDADPDNYSRWPPMSPEGDALPMPDDLPPTNNGLPADLGGNSRRPPESSEGDARPPPHSEEAGDDGPPIDDPERNADPNGNSRQPPMSPKGDALSMPDDRPPDLPPTNNGPPADPDGNSRWPPGTPEGDALPPPRAEATIREVGSSVEEASCGNGEQRGPINDDPERNADPNGNSRQPPLSSESDALPMPDNRPPALPPPNDGLPADSDGNSRRPPESPESDTRPPPPQSGEAGEDGPPIDDPERNADPNGNSRQPPTSLESDALPNPDDLPSVLPPTNDGPPADPDGNPRRPPGIPQGDARPPPRAEANMREVGRSVGEESCGNREQGDPINQGQADGEFTGSFETTNEDEDVQTIPVPRVETAGKEASVGMVQMQQRSRGNPPPGEGWISKRVAESNRQFRFHWISPIRHIEFKRHAPACKFEKLRRGNDNDEVRAWGEYRKLGCTFVVSPELYDQPGTIPHKKASSRSPEKRLCPWRLSERMALKAGSKGTRGSGADGQKSIKNRVVRRVTRVSGKTRVSKSSQKTRGLQKPITIDQKWAQSLVGLRLKVPGIWWNNCTDKIFYAGRISKINFSDKFERYFILELDTGESYPMRYDAVRMYADKDLPEKPPGAESQSASRLLDGGGLSEVDRQEKEQLPVEVEGGDGLAVRHAQAQRASILKDPGPDWTPICVNYGWQCRFHWVSPVRRIEFKKHTAACQFEDLRKKHKNDEVKAWNEYRSNGGQTYVVAPHQYDLPEEPRVVPNAAGPGKRKRSDTPGLAVPKAKRSKKTTHDMAAQLHKASIKSKSKSSPAIKSSKNRHSSLDPSLGVEDILYDRPSIHSPEPNFDNGLNSSKVKIVCFKEETKKSSFFDYYFPGRTLRIEKSLNDKKPPEKMITFVSNKQL